MGIPFASTTMKFAEVCLRLQQTDDPLFDPLVGAIVKGKQKIVTARSISPDIMEAMFITGLDPRLIRERQGYSRLEWHFPEMEQIKKAAEESLQTA